MTAQVAADDFNTGAPPADAADAGAAARCRSGGTVPGPGARAEAETHGASASAEQRFDSWPRRPLLSPI